MLTIFATGQAAFDVFGNHNAVFGFGRITDYGITAFDLAAGQEAFAALLVDGL